MVKTKKNKLGMNTEKKEEFSAFKAIVEQIKSRIKIMNYTIANP